MSDHDTKSSKPDVSGSEDGCDHIPEDASAVELLDRMLTLLLEEGAEDIRFTVNDNGILRELVITLAPLEESGPKLQLDS